MIMWSVNEWMNVSNSSKKYLRRRIIFHRYIYIYLNWEYQPWLQPNVRKRIRNLNILQLATVTHPPQKSYTEATVTRPPPKSYPTALALEQILNGHSMHWCSSLQDSHYHLSYYEQITFEPFTKIDNKVLKLKDVQQPDSPELRFTISPKEGNFKELLPRNSNNL